MKTNRNSLVWAVAMLVPFLLQPVHAQRQHPASFGPITLGKPLPELPACGPRNSEGELPVRQPCLEEEDVPVQSRDWTVTVGNLPFDGGHMLVLTAECGEDRTACPVVQITAPIYPNMCKKVLARLTAKFGAPRYRPKSVQNGFGARWTREHYFWHFAEGDIVWYSAHEEIDDAGCQLEAVTRARQAALNKELGIRPDAKADF